MMRRLSVVLAWMVCLVPCTSADQGWLEDLTGRLDPASPAAVAVAGLPAAAGPAEKISALAQAMRGGEKPGHLWVIPFPAASDPAPDLQKADDAVAHLIHSQYGSQQFADTLAWFSPEKLVQTLARFPHFDWLAPAYYHTGDQRYARAMVRDMMDFVRHAPIERATWVTPQTDPVVNPWNWVLQHWRIMRWIDALAYMRDSPSLPDSTYLQITLHLWKEVEWLLPRMQLGLHNGTLGNIRAVLYAGIHLGEARGSGLWTSTATGMFRYFLESYFYPGEVSIELTLGYSSAVLGQCLKIYEDLPDSVTRCTVAGPLQALVDGHLGLMKPDRSLPRYGDHGDYDFPQNVLVHAGELFDRKDWKAILQEKEVESALLSSPARSMPTYLSGYYAMRDGWGRTAQYLSMDAGPFGTNHQHGDKLSITLSADGAPFIVDPGTAIYRSTRESTLYDLRPGFLHNTITVDGIDPSAGFDQHYQFDVLENRWITSSAYDFLDGVYDYRAAALDVMARRSVLYIRGEYWIILDALYGQGRARIESNLQFAAGTELDLTGETVVARSPEGATLHIASAFDSLALSVLLGDTVFPGSTFPFRYGKNLAWRTGGRGWVGGFGNHSADMHALDPAPALLLHGQAALPHFCLRVLSPSRGHVPRPRTVASMPSRSDGIAARIQGADPSVVDHFLWHPGGMPAIYARPDPEGGCWVRERDGSAEQIIVLNSRQVEFCDGELAVRLHFSERAELIARRRGLTWTLSVDPASPAGVCLEHFEVRRRGAEPQRFVLAEGTSELAPGEQRLLVAAP